MRVERAASTPRPRTERDAPPMSDRRSTPPSRQRALDELRDGRALPARHARAPRRRRARLAVAMHGLLTRARQGLADVHRRPTTCRCRTSTASSSSTALVSDAARRTSTSARSSSSTAATSTATRSTSLKRDGAHILNIDHHHDNTRFGDVNHVVPDASCTAEIVWDLMHDLGVRRRRRSPRRSTSGWSPTPAVHVREHRRRARTHGRRADRGRASTCTSIYRRLYEGMPARKLELLARALAHVAALRRRRADAHARSAARTSSARAPRTAYPRASSTTCARSRDEGRGARARARCRGERERQARSRCARPTARSTSRSIARAQGGGGHRQAAGFTTTLDPTSWSRSCAADRRAAALTRRSSPRAARRSTLTAAWTASCSSTSRSGRPRTTSSARRCGASPGSGREVGHAGTLDPFATGLLLVLLGRATRVQRYLMALPKTYEVVARFGATSTTGDPEGEIIETGRRPARRPAAADGRGPPAAAGLLGGQGRRPARVRARACRRAGRARRADRHRARFEELWRDGDRAAASRSSARRARTCAARRRLGDAYCEQLRRTAIGPFDVGDAGAPTSST